MRRFLPLLLVWLVVTPLAACAVSDSPTYNPSPTAGSSHADVRSVSLGFETLSGDATTLDRVVSHVEASGANAVAVSAGRPEWTAVPWPAHPDQQSDTVASTRRDLVAAALSRVGRGREVTLVVDVLAPRHIAADASLGAKDADGATSPSFPSAAALDGDYGRLVVEYVEHLAKTHHPDAISLTELMVEDPSLPEADRARAVTDLVQRAAEAAHRYDVRLTVDVRANYADPAAGRPDSGQDYARLLAVCDGLTVWAYHGITNRDGSKGDVGLLTSVLTQRWGDRVEISIGMWGDGDAVLPADEAGRLVRRAIEAGATRVNVTPSSLMSQAHWSAVAKAWA